MGRVTSPLKRTVHNYKGFEIIGSEFRTEGGYVLGGRHFIEGGTARNYIITKDGRPIFRFCIIRKLKDAKEQVDEYINRHPTGG